jgi:aspartate dehydrogenase
MKREAPLRVGIVGLGSVGKAVAAFLDRGERGFELVAVSAKNLEGARQFAASLAAPVRVVPAAEITDLVDIVVECAPAAIFHEVAGPVIAQGKTLVALSSGALLDSWELVEAAQRSGAAILVPTGALLGLDAVQAAALGRIDSVAMTTRKPPIGLKGAPYLIERGIDVDDVSEPIKVFSGSARDAALGFPANLNVAVALSLAGIGPDRTRLDIWADPTVVRNTHTIDVVSDSALFTMTIENIPTANPKTGIITALSVMALLRKQTSALRIGT